ncbi:MAG TPA: hypothetical protein VF529_22755 [Solirubrobacteraceae bacterium]
MRTAAILTAVGVAVVAAGCLGDDSTADGVAPARPQAADSTVGCDRRSEPPPSEAVRTGEDAHVAAAALRDGGRFELFTFRGAPFRMRLGARRVWVWKAPASLSADRTVILAVGSRNTSRARLAFGPFARTFARSDRAVRFTSCPPDEPLFSGDGVVGPTTGWGGSLITTDRRICLRLRVFSGGASSPLPVPLGRPCPSGDG